jgi:uncharacterized protein (TIGR03067 family)
MRWRIVLLPLAGLLLAAEPAPEDAAARDKEKLVGTWAVVSVEANGQRFPAEMTRDHQFIFAADKLTRKKGGKLESEAAYRLDPAKTPKRMDFFDPKDAKQKVVPILYALEGDTLKLCFRTDYKKVTMRVRPTKLDGGADSEQVLMVLKREKP